MPGLNFSLLGRLQIEHPQSGAITLTNRKAISLLAYLLVESKHAHSREFLLGLLWPELPTAAAQNNLRVTWSQLQKVLNTHAAVEQPTLIGDRLALRFNPLSDHELDVDRFRTLIESCRRHAHPEPHTCAECAARLTEALALARGDFLDEFSLANCVQFDEWLLLQREHFRMQVTWALEQLAAFHERAGQLAEAERTIRRLLAHDPLSESAYRQMMRVLAGAGQRSAALEAYETCRRVLASELGLAPAVETVMLAEQIRANAPFEPHAMQAALPPVLTRFFGRQPEAARLVDLLSQHMVRLVTLTGPGGVGKTRLAIDVAHRLQDLFAHNVCFVELAGVADESAVDDAVAAALRLPTNSGRSSTGVLVDYLRDRSVLLVLDNCEHLVKACASLVQTLCRAAMGLTVLATSRLPLHLAEEHVVRLEPFATPTINGERLTVADSLQFDSVQLFTDRAAQSLLHFALTDVNVPAVARICQQLDGIPLAIEIAAAQARVLPIAAIAERLDQRFAWLNRPAGATLPRQRTLQTLIDWSYGLLSPQARAGLCGLSVFAGGWTLEAAEAVSVPGEPCVEILTELVDHSLVIFGADAERRRYSMHETIRHFAQEHLRGSDQEAVALERHARYYTQLVARVAENRAGQTLPKRLRTVQDDHDNLRRAFEWLLAHDREPALTLVAQLGTDLKFWELGGFFQEGRRWLQRALDETTGSLSIQRAQALLAAAELSSAISDFNYGLHAARQAQDLFQQLGVRRGEIDARLIYCDLARYAGELTHLQTQIEEALQMAEQIAYTAGIAKGNQLLAINIVYTAGDAAAAIPYELRSVTLWRELGSPFELATALNLLGADLLEIHEYKAAREALLECRDLYQSLGYQRGVALAMHNLGETAHMLGEYANARELVRASLRIRHRLGLLRGYAYSFELLAQITESEDQYAQAVQLWAAAETLRARIGAPLEQVAHKYTLAALTRLRARLGEPAFELAWAKGVHMTAKQAIGLALG
ncbi:MAG: BTAD domain-containing putative transcriptional regulator [Caldilineaceae bacterium]